jgi:hypothetical protein
MLGNLIPAGNGLISSEEVIKRGNEAHKKEW